MRRGFRRDRTLGGLALEASEGASHEGAEPWGVLEQGKAMARGYLQQGFAGMDEFGLGMGMGMGGAIGNGGGRYGGAAYGSGTGTISPLDEESSSIPLEVRAAASRLPDRFGLHPGRE